MGPHGAIQSAKQGMMATAKTQMRKAGRLAAHWRRLLVGFAAVVVGLAWYFGPGLADRAEAGTAYGARVACSCRFVGGRGLEDCRKDFEPGMDLVSLSENDEQKSVTASVPLLASQTATYREGYGCVLERWER
jgi:hypothetical protein